MLAILVLAYFGVSLALEVVRSSLGVLLALLLITVAIVYGLRAAKSQNELDYYLRTQHAEHERQRRVVEAENKRRWRDLSKLRVLSGAAFENHVADTYRKLGYQVTLTRASGDQGVDVIAVRDAERIAIQCKQWSGLVGNDAVQQACSGRTFYDCNQAVVICTSDFTPTARALAQKNGVKLVSRTEYVTLAQRVASETPEMPIPEPIAIPSPRLSLLPRGRPLLNETLFAGLGLVLLTAHFSLASPVSSPSQSAPISATAAQPMTVAYPTATPLQTLQVTPTEVATQAPAVIPTPTEVPTVTVGNTGGIGVYLRHTPRLTDRWVAWPDGTTLVVLADQTDSDGLHWLQVRDPDGHVGWVPSQYTTH